MKYIKIFLILFFCLSEILFAATIKYKHRTNEVIGYTWDANTNCCVPHGDDCYPITDEEIETGEVIEVTGGYNLDLILNSVTLNIKQPSGLWEIYERSGANYSFTNSEYIEIIECSSYTDLVGRTIELFGSITNSNGLYTLFAPN